MKIVSRILLFLVLCAMCLGADKYVDPDSGNDVNSGNTSVDAYKTVDKGWINVGDGDTVFLMPGTYDTTTQGVGWWIDLDIDKSATFKSHAAEVTLVTAKANLAVEFHAVCTGTVTFEDITFDADVPTAFLSTGNGITASIVFDNVTVTMENNDSLALILIYDLNKLWIKNGSDFTITRTLNDLSKGAVINIRSIIDTILIEDSTLTCATDVAGMSNAHDNYVIDCTSQSGTNPANGSPTVNNLILKNSTFEAPNSCIYNRTNNRSGIGDLLYIDNCIFISNQTGNSTSSYPVLALSSGYTFTAWDNAVVDYDADTDRPDVKNRVEHNKIIYRCVLAHDASAVADDEPGAGSAWESYWIINALYKAEITNCTIYSEATIAVANRPHGIFVGPEVHNALIQNNLIYDLNYQLVVKGGENIIIGNVLKGNKCLSSWSYGRNMFLSNSIYSNAGFGIALTGENDGDNAGKYNIIKNNLVYITAAGTYCLTDDGGEGASTADFDNHVDWNAWYNENATNWFKLIATTPDTLAAFQTQWAIQSEFYGSVNSQNAISSDPRLANPAASPPDIRLRPNSPALNTGQRLQDSSNYIGYSTFGAWQKKQGWFLW